MVTNVVLALSKQLLLSKFIQSKSLADSSHQMTLERSQSHGHIVHGCLCWHRISQEHDFTTTDIGTCLVDEVERTAVIADLVNTEEAFAARARSDGNLNGSSNYKHDLAASFGERHNSDAESSLVLVEIDRLQRFGLGDDQR